MGVSVTFDNVPAVSPPKFSNVCRHDIVKVPAYLNIIPVNNGSKVKQALLDSDPARFGKLSLDLFTVTQHHPSFRLRTACPRC